MTYRVHEIFHTLQGEGVHSGTPAVFVRFSGCNLWSGREQDRATAICRFCDTQFRGGTAHDLESLIASIHRFDTKLVVFTGGEPALQLDQSLVDACRAMGRRVAIETNGTIPVVDVDWICVSPKAGTDIKQLRADELKLVFPQTGVDPSEVRRVISADTYWLSPMDGPALRENTITAIEYAKRNAGWRVNIQAHKTWEIR